MKGTGAGLASVILAVCGIFVPMGFMISGLSGLLAILVYKYKDSYALSALILNLANLTILSPIMLMAVLKPETSSLIPKPHGASVIYGMIFLIQVIGLRLHLKRDKKRKTDKDQEKIRKVRIEPKL